jgi:ketosteroid isomerase-like protein
MSGAAAQVAERFYRAFARRDGSAMAACYHPEVHFTDPVFDLHGDDAGLMWRMLCERGADLRIEHGGVHSHGNAVHTRWQAWYTFGATGRPVHNVIDATMTLRDGLVVRHVDRFDFWRWSRQALGLPGLLLGWSPQLRARVQQQAARGLAAYRARSG